LRTFNALLEPVPTRSLRDELRWLADALGAVRDHDVFVARLAQYRNIVEPVDRDALTRLITRFDQHRGPALSALQRALSSKRAATALQAAVAYAIQPPITIDADRLAASSVAAIARDVFDKLDRRARKLDHDSPVDALHELRIIAKRARYATDAAVTVVPGARDQARALARLQDALGDLHDTSIVENALRAALPDMTLDEAVVTGYVIATEHANANRLRTEWRTPWKHARRPRARAWLQPRTKH